MDRLDNLGSNKRTLGDDAFKTDEVTEVAGIQGSWGHVFASETSFKPDEEIFRFLGVRGVNGTNKLFQSSLKSGHFFK